MLHTPLERTSPEHDQGYISFDAIAEARFKQQIIWAQQVNICVCYQFTFLYFEPY